MLEGGCHCGAVRFRMPAEVVHSSLCHCDDCKRCAGAPLVAWAAVRQEQLEVEGEPQTYRSSENAVRSFCGKCGTGLFYVNEQVLPGLVDVQVRRSTIPTRCRRSCTSNMPTGSAGSRAPSTCRSSIAIPAERAAAGSSRGRSGVRLRG